MPLSFFQHAHTAEGIKIAEKRAEIILNLSCRLKSHQNGGSSVQKANKAQKVRNYRIQAYVTKILMKIGGKIK